LHHKHKTSLSEHGKSISQCHCLLNCSFFRGSHWPRTGITTPRKRTQRLHGWSHTKEKSTASFHLEKPKKNPNAPRIHDFSANRWDFIPLIRCGHCLVVTRPLKITIKDIENIQQIIDPRIHAYVRPSMVRPNLQLPMVGEARPIFLLCRISSPQNCRRIWNWCALQISVPQNFGSAIRCKYYDLKI
jgi:hypothetical protein